MRYGSTPVWIVYAFVLQASAAVMDCTSPYVYSRQPPSVVVCNPYISQTLLLDCAVTGMRPVQMQWFFSPASNPRISVVITDSDHYELDDMSVNTMARVGLILRGLTAASENVTSGYYWCQATVPEGKLSPSSRTRLENADYYKFVPFSCSSRVYLRSSDIGCPELLNQTDASVLPFKSVSLEPSREITTIATIPMPPQLATPTPATAGHGNC